MTIEERLERKVDTLVEKVAKLEAILEESRVDRRELPRVLAQLKILWLALSINAVAAVKVFWAWATGTGKG